MQQKKKKAVLALGILTFFGAALVTFIIAADEQSVLSSGLSSADKISLQELIARGAGSNKHIELADFYFGRQYIYTAKLVQFRDVYVPVFPSGGPESGSNLWVLVWIRNDRNSSQRLIESQRDLDKFISEFGRDPRTLSGVLRKPTNQVRTLTAEAYPGVNPHSLQVLWARKFPDRQAVNSLWAICAIMLSAAVVCVIAHRKASR